jgi:hypothetical protein
VRTRIKVGELTRGCVCEGSRKHGSRLLSNPSVWMSRAPTAAILSDRLRFRAVCAWLCLLSLLLALLPAAPVLGVGVVHDHIRLGQEEVVTITCIVVRIGACDLVHAGTGEAARLWAGRRAAVNSVRSRRGRVISDGSADAKSEVLVKCA